MKKYEFTDEKKTIGEHTLHRIRAICDFGDVKAGDIGGWIENEDNLSHDGYCWVYDEACVYDSARVFRFSSVHDLAVIFGNARIYNGSRVSDLACIGDFAQVCDAAMIDETTVANGNMYVSGRAYFGLNVIL